MKVLTKSEGSCYVKMVIHNNVNSAIDFNSQIYLYTYAPCVWQLYENSLKNKDNTWDTKQPIFPDLSSCPRENKSLMLHKYFKKSEMALTMHSLHIPLDTCSVFQANLFHSKRVCTL